MAETFVDISLFPDPPSPARAAPPASEPKLATVAPIPPPATPATVLEEPLPAVESEGKKSAVTRMRAFKDHLEANYHAPDFDAVEIVMCALVSHFYVQSDPVWLFVEGRSRCGKCLGPGTPVLMFDGSSKPVEDVIPGDLLMGDDSTPRRVLSTASGLDEMYKVSPYQGDAYVVNSEHILSLRAHVHQGRYMTLDMPIKDYLGTTGLFRSLFKGYRVGVDFKGAETLPIHPYLLGCWLGDGTTASSGFTSADPEIIAKLSEIVEPLGLKVQHYITKREGNKSISYGITTGKQNGGRWGQNSFLTALQRLKLIGNKHIPEIYLKASRKDRLELLAGLMDTDGNLHGKGCYYEITQKSKVLAEQIQFLARSLGFAAYTSPRQNSWTYKGVKKTGTYYRTGIAGGLDIQQIPCVLARKQKKFSYGWPEHPTQQPLTITALGSGRYYGFELDGNGRFLLGDFTVTHNTSCCINPMTCLPNTYMLGDISTKTFLSGWKDSGKGKGKSNSLLTQIGSSGILLFKDFTTIISKRAETRAEIVAQLRELHDGRMSKNTGMGGTLDWSGKITVIAATTPAVEQQWTMLRQLGERFLTVRYRSETSEDNSNSRKAMAQRGNEREIARKSLSLVAEAVDNKSLPSKIIHPTDEILNRLIHLARIVAMTRAQVVRVEGQIIDIPDYESPTGIAKSLAALVSARAALYRRNYLTDDDLKLATKVALDSIPLRRMQIIQWTPRNDFTSWGEIREHTRLAHSSLKWHLDEMIALNIIYKDSTSANDDCWGFTKEFRESWDLAIPDSVKLAIG